MQAPHQSDSMVAHVLHPEDVQPAEFVPVAYYDRYMDCIRVFIADRSVTEERIDDVLTLYKTNHALPFDPIHCGFCLKGIRHLLDSLNFEAGMEFHLTSLIDAIVKRNPRSTVAKILDQFPTDKSLVVKWEPREAA